MGMVDVNGEDNDSRRVDRKATRESMTLPRGSRYVLDLDNG